MRPVRPFARGVYEVAVLNNLCRTGRIFDAQKRISDYRRPLQISIQVRAPTAIARHWVWLLQPASTLSLNCYSSWPFTALRRCIAGPEIRATELRPSLDNDCRSFLLTSHSWPL